MANSSFSMLFCGLRRCLFIAAVLCVLLCLSTTTAGKRNRRSRRNRGRQLIPSHILDELACRIKPGGCRSFNSNDPVTYTIIHNDSADLTCPSALHQYNHSSAPSSQRTVCPFNRVELELPPGYIPQRVPSVVCRTCSTCLGGLDAGSCQALNTSITVLRPASCSRRGVAYQEKQIEVPTACVCVS